MFERYTEKARRVIFFARYVASQFGSPYIESEHLLLGLLREAKGLISRFFKYYGWAESISREIQGHTTIREKVSTSVDLPLSNDCKRILAYATEEADGLSHRLIGTEHLLLGLLREQNCFAANLLSERGVTLEAARNQIASQPSPEVGPPPKSPGVPAGYTTHKLLYNSASETVIVELRKLGGMHLSPRRLFIRPKDVDDYEQIGEPSEGVSYESPVTCEKEPLVVFNSMRWYGEKSEWVWTGVYCFNLSTKEVSLCISQGGLRFPERHGRTWIVELFSLSDDARKVCVNVGIETMGSVEYYLAKVDLTDPQLEVVCLLRDTRF